MKEDKLLREKSGAVELAKDSAARVRARVELAKERSKVARENSAEARHKLIEAVRLQAEAMTDEQIEDEVYKITRDIYSHIQSRSVLVAAFQMILDGRIDDKRRKANVSN
jgi:5-bromo-4-chloroindolyl phosphate hydrolysis protein